MPVTPRVRLTAVGTSVIALVLAVKIGTLFATAPYLGLLGAVLLLLAVAATVRLWCLGRFACQAAACVLAVSVATGQLLVASVGLPGAASLDRRWAAGACSPCSPRHWSWLRCSRPVSPRSDERPPMLRSMASTVLVVEDDDGIAAPLVRTLQREGYDVERVAAGRPGVDRVLEGGVDVMILDLGLPDIDGLDVCRQVRDAGNGLPILILTARGGELDRVVGLDVGADDYMAQAVRPRRAAGPHPGAAAARPGHRRSRPRPPPPPRRSRCCGSTRPAARCGPRTARSR